MARRSGLLAIMVGLLFSAIVWVKGLLVGIQTLRMLKDATGSLVLLRDMAWGITAMGSVFMALIVAAAIAVVMAYRIRA